MFTGFEFSGKDAEKKEAFYDRVQYNKQRLLLLWLIIPNTLFDFIWLYVRATRIVSGNHIDTKFNNLLRIKIGHYEMSMKLYKKI